MLASAYLKRDCQLGWKRGHDIQVCVCVNACVFLRFIVKSLPVPAAKFSVRFNLQLHGKLPGFHSTISTTWPQSPLSLCMFTSFLSPWGHGFLFSVSCPPLCSPHPSNHSHCLSGSHGPSTKAVGGGQWNNSLHPYGLHFPDRNAVTVLFPFVWPHKRKNRYKGREDKELEGNIAAK